MIYKHWRTPAFLCTFFVTIFVLGYGELKVLPRFSELRIFLIILTWTSFIHVSAAFNKSTKKLWSTLTKITASFFIFYLVIRSVNVYHLPQYGWVQTICQQSSQFCDSVVQIFWSIKFYRFITLSIVFFVAVLLFFAGLWLLSAYKNKAASLLKKTAGEPVLFIVSTLLSAAFLHQVFFVSDHIFYLAFKTWENRSVNFEERFVSYESGLEHNGWMWMYGNFVTAHVPETSTIFIPPQNEVWPQEGNKYYFRWFVHPRHLIQSSDAFAPIPSQADYVLISKGGWKGGEAGWPKREIDSNCIENVHLINRATAEELATSPSSVSAVLNPDLWGVVALKKGNTSSCP